MKFVPWRRSWAIQALLSLAAETWQSVHCLVSLARTVCGTKSAERLAGEAGGGDGLLRVVEPLAIGVLRADEDGAGRARGRDAVIGDRAVDAQHIYVVAEDLKIVAGVVAGDGAFVVEHGAADVGGHLEMATETGGSPRGVAGVAGHRVVGVREVGVVLWHLGLHDAVFGHEFCAVGLHAEVHVAGSDGVSGLHDFPLFVFISHAALDQRAG